jgi:hypothetical protein
VEEADLAVFVVVLVVGPGRLDFHITVVAIRAAGGRRPAGRPGVSTTVVVPTVVVPAVVVPAVVATRTRRAT